MALLDTMRMLRSMSRGVRRGDLLPAAGRLPIRPAPGGSEVIAQEERFVLRRHRVPVRGLAEPLRILQISDAHVRQPTRGFERMCNALAAIHTDIVVLTGDIVAREVQLTALHFFLAHLPQARLGRFAIMGNWEYWAGFDPDRFREALDPHHVRLLRDEAALVGPITLVGTDDSTAASPDHEAALAQAPKGRPTVVLTHSPALFPRLARPEVALVLSGHTHGGQVRLPGLGALWLPRGSDRYVAGFYDQDGTWLHVSQGLGWSMAPIRHGVPAEVSEIELVPGDAA